MTDRCHICFAPCDGGLCDLCRPMTAVHSVSVIEEEMRRRKIEEQELENLMETTK